MVVGRLGDHTAAVATRAAQQADRQGSALALTQLLRMAGEDAQGIQARLEDARVEFHVHNWVRVAHVQYIQAFG